jgi:hypothetical protein
MSFTTMARLSEKNLLKDGMIDLEPEIGHSRWWFVAPRRVWAIDARESVHQPKGEKTNETYHKYIESANAPARKLEHKPPKLWHRQPPASAREQGPELRLWWWQPRGAETP